MKSTQLLLLLLISVFFACQKETVSEEINEEDINEEETEEIIDSVDIDFLDLELPGLPDRIVVNSMAVDQNNILWIANSTRFSGWPNTSAPIFGYDINQEEWIVKYPPAEWEVRSIEKLGISNNGKIYAVPGTGLQNYIIIEENNNWSRIDFDETIVNMEVDAIQDVLWVSTSKGLYRIQDGEQEIFNSQNSVLPVDEAITGSRIVFLAVTDNGTVWAQQNNRLFIYESDGEWKEHPTSPIGDQYIISNLRRASENSAFVQNYDGQFYEVNKDGIINNYTNRIFEEDENIGFMEILKTEENGNLKMGLLGGYLYYSPSLDSLRLIDQQNAGFPQGLSTYRLAKDKNGNTWGGGNFWIGKLPELFE